MPASGNLRWFVALGVGLAVMMLLAVVLPRLVTDGEANWWLSIGGGIAAAVLVVVLGAARKEGTREPTRPEH